MSETEVLPVTKVMHLKGTTVLSVKHVTFNWTVCNFSEYSKHGKQVFRSQKFTIGKIPYKLRLETPDNDVESPVTFFIHLLRIEKGLVDQFIKYKLSLLDRNGNPMVTHEAKVQFGDKKLNGPRMEFCSFENLKDNFQLLHNDTLHIRCEATILSREHFEDNKLKAFLSTLKEEEKYRGRNDFIISPYINLLSIFICCLLFICMMCRPILVHEWE